MFQTPLRHMHFSICHLGLASFDSRKAKRRGEARLARGSGNRNPPFLRSQQSGHQSSPSRPRANRGLTQLARWHEEKEGMQPPWWITRTAVLLFAYCVVHEIQIWEGP